VIARLLVVAAGLFALWAAPGQAATWCGTAAGDDRRPQVLAGQNVHAVYVLASDGADNTPAVAQAMQNDAEAIDAWWRAQDATRTLRFDLFPFPCGPQLDLTVIRLPSTTAQLRVADGRADAIWEAIRSSPLSSSYVKYLVYYDGPTDGNICGQGDETSDGSGIAIVYMAAVGCQGVTSQTIAAHELLHAFGALPPSGPPSACSSADTGHPCDSEQDILYPSASENGLAWYTLDVGRNDYYGHPGAWLDIQDSVFLRRLDAQVRVSLQLSGGGSVESDIPGLECTATCEADWNRGTVVGLTPHPAAGQRFIRWGGACSGAVGCTLRLEQGASITALFAPARFRLAISRAGRGTVRSGGREILCPARCAAAVTSHAPLRLSAVAAKGWRFARWSGGCTGTRATCTLPMTKASAARAVFVRRPAR
jgi:Divergent InlB B-repeat domain